jgi:hypothetical protein
MGLGTVLDDCGVQARLPSVRRQNREDVLVECRWADDDAIEGLAGLISDRLWDAHVDAEVTDLVSVAVYEIADNVKAHAGSGGGFICAQTYRRGTPYERVEVAVGDIGRGVRASLEARHSPVDDEHALRLATTESVTSLPEDRRGLGLHYVARDIPRAGGRLAILSGDAMLQVNPSGAQSTKRASIVGTLVEVRVPVGGLRKGSGR